MSHRIRLRSDDAVYVAICNATGIQVPTETLNSWVGQRGGLESSGSTNSSFVRSEDQSGVEPSFNRVEELTVVDKVLSNGTPGRLDPGLAKARSLCWT